MSQITNNELLKAYVDANVSPILVEQKFYEVFGNAITIPATCSDGLLLGRYEDEHFVAPAWYDLVIQRKNMKYNFLVINDISSINKDEQLKFYELLKYRKIGVNSLPDNCVIIVTSKNINKLFINERIYGLVTHVTGGYE